MLLLFSVIIIVGVVVAVVLMKTSVSSTSTNQNKSDQPTKVDSEKSYVEALKLLEVMSEHRPKHTKYEYFHWE
jgi:hypothetical protein